MCVTFVATYVIDADLDAGVGVLKMRKHFYLLIYLPVFETWTNMFSSFGHKKLY